MDALPPLNLDYAATLAPTADPTQNVAPARPINIADGHGGSTATAPPHLLWETLESAYAMPGENAPALGERRLARHIALPIVVALSLAMWVAIVDLVFLR